ncbi:MAG: hypothetical protein RLZZ401_716, partial [Pseudomonadota bacterium]
TDGSVYGWGDNYCGRLSPNLTNDVQYSQPQLIAQLKDITSIRTASSGTIARDKTGTVYTWGYAGSRPSIGRPFAVCGTGTLSTGQTFDFFQTTTIEKEPTIKNISDIYVEGNNYFALTAAGVLYGWGEGFSGLLANSDGTLIDGQYLQGVRFEQPTKIEGLTDVRSLAFTQLTAYALQRDGTVKAWGNDSRKLLGNGVQKRTLRPTTVPGLVNVANIQGVFSGLRLQQNDGTTLAWGEFIGSMGSTDITSYIPLVIPTPDRVRYFAARNIGFSVFFASGKVGRDFNNTTDVTPSFR